MVLGEYKGYSQKESTVAFSGYMFLITIRGFCFLPAKREMKIFIGFFYDRIMWTISLAFAKFIG